MTRVGVIAGILVLVMSGCGGLFRTPPPELPGNVQLPAPDQGLPDDAEIAFASDWADGSGRLPAGIDPDARWETDIDAIQGVTTPFGDRPLPPNSPGVTGEGLASDDPAVVAMLVTVPVGPADGAWGEQFVLIVRHGADGWALNRTFNRTLCLEQADDGLCADDG
jgi:hypothetical protein